MTAIGRFTPFDNGISLNLSQSDKSIHQGMNMSKERATVTWEELSWSNHIEQEALVRLLIDKDIITQEELLDEVQQVQSTYAGKKS